MIVNQDHSVRFLNLTAADVQTNISQFQNDHSSGQPLIAPRPLDQQFSGILHGERIVGIVHNYLRHELIVVTSNEQTVLSYLKVVINKAAADKRYFTLAKYEAPVDQKGTKKAKSLQQKLAPTVPSEVQQLYYIANDGLPFLLVLRVNQQLELVYNFSDILFVE